MIVSLRHFLGWMFSACRSREDLVLENLALRRQLLALHVQRPRHRLTTLHKLFWIDPVKRWLTFLRNHREVIAAMDFFMQSQRRLKSHFLMTKQLSLYPAKARFTFPASIFRRSTNQPAIPNRTACAKQKEILFMSGTTNWRTTGL
jgi:hypothetical protein